MGVYGELLDFDTKNFIESPSMVSYAESPR